MTGIAARRRLHSLIEAQMSVAFQGRQEHGQQRLEPLAAHAVGRLPEDDECLADGLVERRERERFANAIDPSVFNTRIPCFR